MIYDAVIIGGGAAGLFCAMHSARRGKRVVVVEHNAEVGRKIVISGGGRCNFTNVNIGPENFISQNPHFSRSALARFTPADLIALVRKHRIAFFEKKLGQLFCENSSRQIVEMLVLECGKASAEIRTGCSVSEIKRDDLFAVGTSFGVVRSRSLIVACGGRSFPKIGASGLGYQIARQFGLKIVDTRPSLVAMILRKNSISGLAGVSAPAVVSTEKASFRENILFTHRGLSGPAILQISNYWKPGTPVSIDLLPDHNVEGLIHSYRSSRRKLSNFLADHMPVRLAQSVAGIGSSDKPLCQFSNVEIEAIGKRTNDWQAEFSETEGWDRAEVTLGGVSTDELSSKTMEARKVPGLYFIGEVVDVTGWLGGYNFQWAWSSGYAAGTSV